MHKQLISGLLMAAALAPAGAASLPGQPAPQDQVHRRTIMLCMLLGIGLRGLKRRALMPNGEHPRSAPARSTTTTNTAQTTRTRQNG